MKKKLIYSSALAALLSASSIALAGGPEIIPIEDYFSGFYVGGTGSVHHADMDSSSQVNLTQNVPLNVATPLFVPGTILSSDTDGGSVDGYGGVQGGFGWTFNHVWYLGIQGFGDFGQQKSTATSNSTPISFVSSFRDVNDTATVNTSTTVQIQNDYGVAGKLGYVVAPTTMVYGKIGASWANIKVSNSTTAVNNFNVTNGLGTTFVNVNTVATGSSSSSNTSAGLLLGIGAEHFIYQDIVSLNVEYDYTNYGTVNTGPVPLFASTTVTVNGNVVPGTPTPARQLPVTTQASGSASVDEFLAGINFYFGRNWF